MWILVLSDVLIAIAYFIIPIEIYYYAKKENLQRNPVTLLFFAFILACGTTHLIQVFDVNELQEVFLYISKITTAIVSMTTALALLRVFPQIAKIPHKYRYMSNIINASNLSKDLVLALSLEDNLDMLCSGFENFLSKNLKNFEGMRIFQDNILLTCTEFVDVDLESELDSIDYKLKVDNNFQLIVFGKKIKKHELDLYVSIFEQILNNFLLREKEKHLNVEKNKLEANMTNQGHFFTNISHDLRTPMHSIIECMELLEPEVTSHNIFEISWNSSNYLVNLLDNILEFYRYEGNQVEINNIEFSLIDLIYECVNVILFKAKKKGINIYVLYSPDVAETVVTDRNKLKQLMINLFSNAIKYTENGYVKIRAESESESVKIIVEDSGIGMNEELMENLFNRFKRANHGGKIRGFGLGLSICKKISEALNGHIDVYSELGKGSVFTTYLNIEQIHRGKYSKINMGKKILVDFTDPINEQSLIFILKRLGCEIVEDKKEADMCLIDIGLEIKNKRIIDIYPIYIKEVYDVLRNKRKRKKSSVVEEDIIQMLNENEETNENDKLVIFADDWLPNLELGKLMLKQFNVTNVAVADDGSRVLEILKKIASDDSKLPDIIMLDLHMKDLHGDETALEIRKTYKDIPIVILTADATIATKEKIQELGINDFLTKPYTKNQMEEILEKYDII